MSIRERPGLTRILPWLVSWAAAGVMIVTASATLFHLVRGEMSSAATTLVLLVMAAFVARGRHGASLDRRPIPHAGADIWMPAGTRAK